MSASMRVLLALVPYTRQNLQLTYHPTAFFDELERQTDYSRRTLQQAMATLRKRQLVSAERVPQLTAAGQLHVQPYVAQRLANGAQLLVIFDVPEDFSAQRRQLRRTLQRLGFTQVQRSVWMSSDDHVSFVKDIIRDLRLEGWVEVYEAARLA